MTALTAFSADVSLEVPGVISGQVLSAVRKTVREFCRRSTRWRADLPALTLVANQSVYTVGNDANHLVLRVDSEIILFASGTQNGVPLEFLRKEDMDKLINWQQQTGGQVKAIYPTDPMTINTYPIPTDTTYPLMLRVALMPTPTAATCADFIFNDWNEVITAGAVARLLALTDKEWTDLKLAEVKRAEFLEGVADAAIQQDRGYSTRVRTAQVPHFGR